MVTNLSGKIVSKYNIPDNTITEVKVKTSHFANQSYPEHCGIYSCMYADISHNDYRYNGKWTSYKSGYYTIGHIVGYTANQWQIIIFERRGGKGLFRLNNVIGASVPVDKYSTGDLPFFAETWLTSGTMIAFDYILVRAYSSNPPSVVTFSGEQTNNKHRHSVSFGSDSLMVV